MDESNKLFLSVLDNSCNESTFHQVAYIIMLLVAVLQWLAIVPLALRAKVFHTVPLADLERNADLAANKEPDACTSPVPFVRDIWFTLRNLIPILLLGLYGFIWYHWDEWSTEFPFQFLKNSDSLGHKYIWDSTANNIFCSNAWLTLGLIMATAACIAQLTKHQKHFSPAWLNFRMMLGKSDRPYKRRYKWYWWDIRNSKPIYYIRLVALWFNMFTVVVIGGTVLQLSVFLSRIALTFGVNARLLHPDGMAGMDSIGTITLSIASVCLVISGMAVVALFDHLGQNIWHNLADPILIIVPFFVGVWMFAGPPMLIHHKVMKEYNRVLPELSARISYYQREYLPEKVKRHVGDADLKPDPSVRWKAETWDKVSAAAQLIQRPRFPLNLALVGQMLVSWLLPMGIKLYLLRRSKEEEPEATS